MNLYKKLLVHVIDWKSSQTYCQICKSSCLNKDFCCLIKIIRNISVHIYRQKCSNRVHYVIHRLWTRSRNPLQLSYDGSGDARGFGRSKLTVTVVQSLTERPLHTYYLYSKSPKIKKTVNMYFVSKNGSFFISLIFKFSILSEVFVFG